MKVKLFSQLLCHQNNLLLLTNDLNHQQFYRLNYACRNIFVSVLFKESIMTLTAYYQLRNTKAAGLGFELLTSEPGAFIVLEECSYEKLYEITR